MDKLRSNVNLVQYSQKNPYQIYTEEGLKFFNVMLDDIAYGVLLTVFSNRVGRKSLITKEMLADPIFMQVRQSFNIDPYKTIDEQEEELITLYKNILQRLKSLQEQGDKN